MKNQETLDQVAVTETALSHIDGDKGILVVGGYNIEKIAFETDVNKICQLLWSGFTSTTDLEHDFGQARDLAYDLMRKLPAVKISEPMDSLRTWVSLLGMVDTKLSPETLIVGSIPMFVAGWHASNQGKALPKPDGNLSMARDYLRMMTDSEPANELTAALDTYLVTVADHGMNASTFTARVIASTRSDMISAVVGAIGALKGPLHGGAPGPVLDMLEAVGPEGNAEQWIKDELASGRRIMGMGHRIYRVRDPRAAIFEQATLRLGASGLAGDKVALAQKVERAATKVLRDLKPDRPLCANVEFYTAVLLDAIGIPRELFTPTFAVGRAIGWCAHVMEQWKIGKLIRPTARYIGESSSC